MNILAFNRSREPYRRFRRHLEGRLSYQSRDPLAVLPDGPLGRDEALREVQRLSHRLKDHGLGPGRRIALFCRSDRRLILLVIAALREGVAFVVGDPEAGPEEASRLLATCEPDAVVADPECLTETGLGQTAPVPVLSSDGSMRLMAGTARSRLDAPAAAPNVAMMIFTSGTASSAKAVELTYGNLAAQLEIFAEVYRFGPGIRLLNLLPLHHTDGLTRGPISALWFGGTLLRPFPFSVQAAPQLLETVRADRATHLITVPAMLRIIQRVGRDHRDAFRTPDFRFVLSSADFLDPPLWTGFEEQFGVPVVNAYGLSEVVCDALFAGPDDGSRIIGTIGRPVGVSAKVVDGQGRPVASGAVGELTLKGPTVMQGYSGLPEFTAEVLRDGVFHTGDLVRQRQDGLFEFVGRKKAAIVSAGVTIHPEGVTAVLSTMPGLAEAFAFGLPDAARGERLVAAVVPMAGEVVTAKQVWDFCRDRLSPELTPVEIRILDALPRRASGKVSLPELRAAMGATEIAAPCSSVYDVAASCFRVPAETLSKASTPFNTPGWDSLAHLALVTGLEQAFGVVLSAQEIVGLMSLGDAEDLLALRIER